MKSRAEQEWDEFEKNFYIYADKRIVLYGIGRGTATLVSENKRFRFVGLMDRETENIGKNMYTLPVVSLSEAEKIADMIVISAPETYWEIIYKRIKHSRIPVYYRNGKKACANERKNATIKEIREKLQSLSTDEITEKMINNICDKLFCQQISKSSYSGILGDTAVFDSLYTFGYCLWGPIVFTFCEWLYWQSKVRNVNQLVFLSRDGYLLQQDYDFFIQQYDLQDTPISKYLLISRRVATVVAIETLEDFQEWVCFPFNGTFSEYMWNRFMVDVCDDTNAQYRIQMPHDKDKVWQWIKKYGYQIENSIRKDKDNYKKYLEKVGLQDNFALVDIGYTGSIQKKLSHVLKRKIKGFYFVCDLSPENKCLRGNEMVPCFQKESDINASEASIYRKPQLLESMFTAPYGMVMALDEHLEKVCAASSHNQLLFEKRIEINRGIKSFIHDMKVSNDGSNGITERRLLVDELFGILLEDVTLDSEIEKIFYWEDAIVQTRENMIFC